MAAQQQLQQQAITPPASANPLNSSIDSANVKTSAASSTTASSTQGAGSKPTQAHSDDDSGCALEEYTWVPPGLKPDQVSPAFLFI